MTLTLLVTETLSIAFVTEDIGRATCYNDFAIVANRLFDQGIDVTRDKLSPRNIAKVSELVLDYCDEILAMREA